MFKIYDCDFGFKLNGVDYLFPHVVELTIEDPEKNRLTRGANATDKIGISYKEGMKEPKKWTIPILAMTADMKSVLDGMFKDQSRVTVYCVSRTDGASKMAKNAVLCNQPQQLSVAEGVESLNVSLEFETFD